MRRFILTVAAVAMSLALAATAEAGGKGGFGGSRGHSYGSRSYHEEHGTRFSGGCLSYILKKASEVFQGIRKSRPAIGCRCHSRGRPASDGFPDGFAGGPSSGASAGRVRAYSPR